MKTKIRIFETYVASIFLYNSEIWTLTKSKENKINAFQHKILRKILNIKWPKKITNEELMKKTKQRNWTSRIKIRRLSYYGHLCRLNENTPAQRALKYITINKRKKCLRGGQRKTWIKQITEDLNHLNLTTENAEKVAQDRSKWRRKCTYFATLIPN